jgi:hypothetical protein
MCGGYVKNSTPFTASSFRMTPERKVSTGRRAKKGERRDWRRRAERRNGFKKWFAIHEKEDCEVDHIV